ncbi:MFS transporter [Rhizobium cremeum]|uniref:MFS transporter n=1 Tax=Rhizobium cremeum TaxID=2813827 RepID=UPI000DDD4D8C|nr:MFS transporter [Rhizobium cremeum]MCJ7995166.1 MFS transporter [Rhizobium cremeum]MCJ8000522.1 MFS transporter [Rhizobium cremeum]
MADGHPLEKLAREPMHPRQIVAIAILTACTAIEGFDVYAISFAAPGIAEAWGIDRATLGIVLAMDLVGMAIGSILLGLVSDRLGRKPIIVSCLVIMATGMWLASWAPTIFDLSAARFYTGLGVGGLLASSSAIAAELANDRRRSLAIALMIGGFSLGAIAGGTLISELLARTDRWEAVFEVGALATTILIVPALLFVPESLVFLCQYQPRNALARLNRILLQQGRSPIDALPSRPLQNTRCLGRSARDVRRTAFFLTLAFFAYMVSLYFLMKWIPKLVADMGYSPSSAGGVLVWAHIGGLLGTITISLLSQIWNVRLLVVSALICGAAAVAAFGRFSQELSALTVIASAAGFFIIGANSGFYSIVAQSFSSQFRAAGTGFVIGVGRAGSATGPIIAGLLFQIGWSLDAVSIVMALGCLIASLSVALLAWPTERSALDADSLGLAEGSNVLELETK